MLIIVTGDVLKHRAKFAFLSILFLVRPADAYSVLSHEALIDALWLQKIRPALLDRFPEATPDELRQAHGFAYGGAIIQDMGYYPHSNGWFSDFTHYVRTGDFISALLNNAKTLDEYAFALGSLSHYAADDVGHKIGTNVGEALLYPRLARKFGKIVTYEEQPIYHLRTEFGFDVLEVARGNYAPAAYHDFIGFNVATDLLVHTFREIYGFDLGRLFDIPTGVDGYRSALSGTIPTATRIAWAQRKNEIVTNSPQMTRSRFVYIMSRSSYQREWGKQYDQPTLLDRFLAFLLKLIPPIGPLQDLKFHMPTPEVERIFMHSFDEVVTEYTSLLDQQRAGKLHLENENFDLGVVAGPGVYKLQDQTYAYWLNELTSENYAGVSPEISQTILAYYKDLNAPFDTKRRPKEWKKVLSQLDGLKQKQAQSTQPVAQ